MPETDFAAWEGRVGLTRVADTAKVLGITRQSAYRLRVGDQQPHPSTRRLMQVIEDNPSLLEQGR